MATQLQYFNKLINLTMSGTNDAFKITCPRHGIKPKITISGSLNTESQVQQLEITVNNLYTSKPLIDYKKVVVEAGYDGSVATAFVGTITGIYTSKPGPDKETTIIANIANITDWIETTANINEKAGTTLQSVAEELSQLFGFAPPYIVTELKTKTLPAPLMINGTARSVISALKLLFPGMDVIINSNQMFFYPESGNKMALEHKIKFLSQAPQYSADYINLSAPWLPNLKPGDIVSFPTKFYSLQNGLAQPSSYGKMTVRSVQFTFGTYGENEMSVTGEALK